MRRFVKLLFFLTLFLAACQSQGVTEEAAPTPDAAAIVLPDEHLILATTPTAAPIGATPAPAITPTAASPPPLYLAQDGALLILDAESGDYLPDPAFPAELQGQVTAARSFTNVDGHYWLVYGPDQAVIAERFPDEDDVWTNLSTAAPVEETVFNPNWERELIGFDERDLVIVADTAGVDNFEFLFVHAPWMTAQAAVSDVQITGAEQLHKALNYLRATAANQGILAITENGLELVPSPLPHGWRLQLTETGDLRLLDSAGEILPDENPQDYLLFEAITVVVSTGRPAVVLPMYRDTVDESQTRHFLQAGRLIVHHYIPESALRERYIVGGDDWEVAALGLRQAAVLLANPRDLWAQIDGPYRGQLNLPVMPAGTIRADFNDWYTEGPQSFDRYLLGQNPPFDFETALETAVHFPLRLRLTLSEE
jgi:hypothetical protein